MFRNDSFRSDGGGSAPRQNDFRGIKHGLSAYGRTQTAFSENGLPVGAGLEDLGKGLRSQVGTMFSTREKGPRYLEMAEGYILEVGLDENDEIIGYKFINFGKMMDCIKAGMSHEEAFNKNVGTYGRFAEAVKTIDPRRQ